MWTGSPSIRTRGDPNFKRDLGRPSESSVRHVLAHRDDASRELTLTVLAFDVPTQVAGAAVT
jgi:hypothetical protein